MTNFPLLPCIKNGRMTKYTPIRKFIEDYRFQKNRPIRGLSIELIYLMRVYLS